MTGSQPPTDLSPGPPPQPDVHFALQAAQVGTWDLDIIHQQVWWDERCQELYGFERDDLVPYQQVLSYTHPDDRSRVDEAVQWALNPQSGGYYDSQFRTLGASDGQLRWLHCRGRAFFNEQGVAYRFSGIAQDVTPLIQATQQLDHSQARFADLVMATPVATAVFAGRDMLIQQVNPPMLAIWGKEPSVIGKTLHQAMPELEGQPFLAQLQHVFDTGEPFRHSEGVADLLKDGQAKRVWFNHAYNPLYDSAGQIYGIINVAIDVTVQVLARRESEANFRQFRTVLQAITQMTWTNTPTGEVDFYNERWYAYTGLSFEQTRDWGWQAVVHPEDLPQTGARFAQALATGEEFIVENRYRRADGQYRWHLNRALPLYDEDGQLVKWVGTATDIHAQKQLEAHLEQQVQQRTQELAATNEELLATNEEFMAANQALESTNHDLIRSNKNLEQFAYIASHDLQEPLRKIQQFGDLLQSQYGDQLDEGAAYLERMQTAATRMSMLIKDLLAFSRISTTQVIAQPVALDQVVSRVLDTLSVVVEESGAQVEVASLPVVPGDRSQLDQLFQNLLSNAFKFRRTNPAGELITPQISIKASQLPRSELPAPVQPTRYAQTYHCIEVADNGIGFDEKYLDRIFQVFQRLHGKNEYAGTGIGLAIVQKVVANHGGAVTATSEPGQGATFLVYLPA